MTEIYVEYEQLPYLVSLYNAVFLTASSPSAFFGSRFLII
jgi:hypothetical protein